LNGSRDIGLEDLSVAAVKMRFMVKSAALRRIGAPVVAAGPTGVRIRTRIHVTGAEVEALTAIGSLLGSVYRTELKQRIELGRLDRRSQMVWRAERKQSVTVVSSSRWAGAITRAAEDQYQLAMRCLAAHVADLRQAVEVVERRCAVRVGEWAQTGRRHGGARNRRSRGYCNAAERFAKTRRLAILRSRLATADAALAAGRPSISVGGKRLWRVRTHLDETDMTEEQWREQWDAARMFFTADGESGKPGGNETIQADGLGRLGIKVPAALTAQFGSHLQIASVVKFANRGRDWGRPGEGATRRAV
jgi:hypothetical protein